MLNLVTLILTATYEKKRVEAGPRGHAVYALDIKRSGNFSLHLGMHLMGCPVTFDGESIRRRIRSCRGRQGRCSWPVLPTESEKVASRPSLRMKGDARGGCETALQLSDGCIRDEPVHAVDLRDSMLQEACVQDAFVGASTGVSGPLPAATASAR